MVCKNAKKSNKSFNVIWWVILSCWDDQFIDSYFYITNILLSHQTVLCLIQYTQINWLLQSHANQDVLCLPFSFENAYQSKIPDYFIVSKTGVSFFNGTRSVWRYARWCSLHNWFHWFDIPVQITTLNLLMCWAIHIGGILYLHTLMRAITWDVSIYRIFGKDSFKHLHTDHHSQQNWRSKFWSETQSIFCVWEQQRLWQVFIYARLARALAVLQCDKLTKLLCAGSYIFDHILIPHMSMNFVIFIHILSNFKQMRQWSSSEQRTKSFVLVINFKMPTNVMHVQDDHENFL